jgi:hypothetical protein
MAYSNRIAWEGLRTIDSATFTGLFQPVGGPLLFPSYICKLVNNSTVLVTISVDGTNAVDVAPANSFWLYDEGKVGRDGAFPALSKGTRIFVSGAAGTGSVYVVSQYIVNE